MASWVPLWTTPGGAQAFIRDNEDGTFTIWSTQDNDPFLEQNKVLANHNDGWSESRELRRAASIPLSLIEQWKAEEGWNALNPHHHDRLKRKLNDSDWAHLRTAHWTV